VTQVRFCHHVALTCSKARSSRREPGSLAGKHCEAGLLRNTLATGGPDRRR